MFTRTSLIPSRARFLRSSLQTVLVAAAACGPVASAAMFTWNGGAGTWDTSTANWLNASGSVAWPASGTDNDGVFGGTASSVTLSGDVAANELLFGTAGYAVQGAGAITFNGAAPTVTVATGTATIGSAAAVTFGGSAGLSKAGVGTLLLNPSAASTLTGGVTVSGGTLAVSFANLATPTNLMPAGNGLRLANGGLSVVGNGANVLTSQTFAGLSVGAGLSTLALTRTSGTVQVDVGTVTQSAAGSVVTFQGVNTTTSPVKVANTPTAYLGTWAIAGDSRTSSARWAYVNASGLLTTITGNTVGTNWVNVTSATTIYSPNNSATLAANATALAVQNPAQTGNTVTLGNFNITTSGISKLTSFTDTYTSGTGTGSIVVGASNELVMMGNGSITIAAPIANGVAGNSAVTYVGGGTLRFDSKASTYTGPTTVSSGVVRIGSGGSINGSSGIGVYGGKFVQSNTTTAVTPAVTLRSGTVDGTGTIAALTVADAATATVTNGDGSTTALTLGSLTFGGDATLNLNTAGPAGVVVTGSLATTPANGTVTINLLTSPAFVTGSTYNLVGYGAFAGSASDFTLGLVPGLGTRKHATLGTTGPANGFLTLAITGETLVWTGLQSAFWLTAADQNWKLQGSGSATEFLAGDDVRFDDTATGSTTIDISSANVSPNITAFANVTKDYAITSSGGFGIASGVVTKSGAGLVRFDTTNTYTGVTTINGGTLAVNSGAAIADTGLVTLANAPGATLQVAVSETIGALSGGGLAGGAAVIPAGQSLGLGSGTQTFAGSVSGDGTLVNAGAVQTISGVVSVSGGVSVTSGRLNLGGANTYAGETVVSPGAAVVATADGGLGVTGTGHGTVLLGAGGAVGGVLGFSSVNYTAAEQVTGAGLGNTAAVSGLAAVQRGFVQGVSGSSRFAGAITISGSGISRIGVQNGAILNLAGAIAPAAGVTGVTVLFRAGDTNGDFVILSGTNNAWDNDAAIYTGNNTAGQYSGVRLGASNALPTNAGVYGTSNAQLATTLDLNGFDQRLNGLTGSTQTSGGIAQLRITNLAAGGTSTLTLDVTEKRSTWLTTLQEVAGGGTLALVKTGTGVQVLDGVNTYTGPTTVSAGALVINGRLGNTAVTVGSGAALGGSGTIAGPTTIQSAATLAPGASVGTLSFGGDLTWNGNGNYNWQMLSGTGSAGASDSWDLVNVTGTLAIAATNANPFRVNLWSLSGVSPDVSGSAANFDPAQNYTWKIASAAGGISGFAADKFVVTTSATNGTDGFTNALGGGTFSIARSGNDLNLVFTAGGGPSVITINVASGTQTQTQAGYPLLSGSVPVLKTGAGTLVVDKANTLTGSTAVQGGVVRLADGAALGSSKVVPLAGGTLALTPYLQTTVGGLAPNAGGLTDVGSGMVTVAAGLSAADMVTAIVTGMGDGSWNGTSGITSSAAAASGGDRTIGWLDNGDGSVTFAFAAAGDTNLDWQVDIIDAANFLAGGKFDTGSPASWNEGDFTYDGVVDILDAASFLSNGLFDAGAYNPPPGRAGAIAAVPEPSCLGAALVGVLAVVGWRSRSRRIKELNHAT